MKRIIQLSFAITIAFASCKEEVIETGPIELAVNGDLEGGTSSPDNWVASGSSPFELEWTDQESNSGTRALSISRATTDPYYYASWDQHLCDVPPGKTLVLSARIKGQLNGAGVSIALRSDPESNSENGTMKFVTTEGQVPITGNFGWQTFQLTMTDIPEGNTCLYVFLVYLTETSGKVYFDDVSLIAQ